MKKEEIIKKIEETDEQIKKFKKRLKTSDLCEDLYDQAILNKAILKKQLEECENKSLLNYFKNLIPKRKKTLICDFFK